MYIFFGHMQYSNVTQISLPAFFNRRAIENLIVTSQQNFLSNFKSQNFPFYLKEIITEERVFIFDFDLNI